MSSYCPFDIPWKADFCLAFYFKWKYFVLVDHILIEAICFLCFCVLFSNIYTKIKVMAKSWSDLCNFYSKVIFRNFCLRKHFLLFLAKFELVMFYNNIVKISKKLNKWNMLKIWLKLPTLQIYASFGFIFTMGKSENIWFFKNQWLELNFLYVGSYDKWFCIKSWQKFANLLLLCKVSSKKRLSERCRKHCSFYYYYALKEFK